VISTQGDMTNVENWMGQGARPKRAQHEKKTYFSPCTNFQEGGKAIKLLRNGNVLNPARLASKRAISVKNTCGFDSLFFVACTAYLDSSNLRESLFFAKKTKGHFTDIVQSFCKEMNVSVTYKHRALLISEKFPELRTVSKETPGLEVYDCKYILIRDFVKHRISYKVVICTFLDVLTHSTRRVIIVHNLINGVVRGAGGAAPR
jgi:hypothetical protein